jgi:hypothetical protein
MAQVYLAQLRSLYSARHTQRDDPLYHQGRAQYFGEKRPGDGALHQSATASGPRIRV